MIAIQIVSHIDHSIWFIDVIMSDYEAKEKRIYSDATPADDELSQFAIYKLCKKIMWSWINANPGSYMVDDQIKKTTYQIIKV
jgi:hypothetical protein